MNRATQLRGAGHFQIGDGSPSRFSGDSPDPHPEDRSPKPRRRERPAAANLARAGVPEIVPDALADAREATDHVRAKHGLARAWTVGNHRIDVAHAASSLDKVIRCVAARDRRQPGCATFEALIPKRRNCAVKAAINRLRTGAHGVVSPGRLHSRSAIGRRTEQTGGDRPMWRPHAGIQLFASLHEYPDYGALDAGPAGRGAAAQIHGPLNQFVICDLVICDRSVRPKWLADNNLGHARGGYLSNASSDCC
jgi:hypothetical protein